MKVSERPPMVASLRSAGTDECVRPHVLGWTGETPVPTLALPG